MAEPLLLSASVEVSLQKIISITTDYINHVFGSSQESSSLNTMMKNLFSHSTEETNVVPAIREELEKLKGSLCMIQPVSQDKQRLQDKAEIIKLWLQKVGDLAYDADNALAEFGYEILRHEVELQNQTKNKVSLFPSHSSNKEFRQEMMPKVSDIRNKLEMINKEVKEFAISDDFKIIIGSPPQREVSHEIGSLIAQPKIVGRESDVSKIVEMLISPNNQVLSVISIVGISGVGKTTLAQSIYNDWRIVKKFDRRIWVDVSGDVKIKKHLKLILESLTSDIFDSESKADLVENLKSELAGSRYLLVLDDLWNVKPEIWDEFREILVDISGTKSNSVLVLSQSVEEASSISTVALHFLEKVSPENCWSIIKEKTGAGGEKAIGLEDIGMQIADKCQGLPLAANVLGGLLQNKGRDFWLSILESGVLDTDNIVSQILRLSFDYLPSPFLKRCFAFCSMFPSNSVMEREQLVQLWMAEGFIDPWRGSHVLEEEGNLYFDILLKSSLLQATVKDKYNKITQCKMHNLVHDFASSLSRFESVNFEGSIRDEIPQIRHLALKSFGKKAMKIAQEKARHLQTLFLKSSVPDNILLDFNYLHVLNLCGADVEELPAFLGRLRHLEYLDLSKTKIGSLPDSLCELYKLQTLRIIGCESLESLPENCKNLLSLRHLHFYYDEFFSMPFGIGQLTHLQTLPIYNVGEIRGPRIGELNRLKDLRGKLEIRNLDLVKDKKEAKGADLFGKYNLQELELRWINQMREGDNNDENVLAGLEPHPSLKSLKIEDFMGDRFPSWVMEMSVGIDCRGGSLRLNNLVELKLERCERCKEIPTLGLLPHLQYLELRELSNVSCIGPSFYCADGSNSNSSEIQVTKALFPALKSITMHYMPNLVDWKGAEDISAAYELEVFPRLESLHVTSCSQLTTAPSHFPALKELIVEYIDSSSPLEKICTTKLTTLTNLKINSVQQLIYLPGEILEHKMNLARLLIKNCKNLIHIFL